jgi:DNA-binding LacI/PurR family transcriptional regulator
MLQQKRRTRVTLADVAKEAGVSVSTVSAVLGKRPHCYAAESTKEHVIQVARTLGYRPNVMARSLRGQSTRTIGVLVHGLKSTGVATAKLQSIEDTAWRHQYRILLGTHRDEQDRLDAYLEEMLGRSVDVEWPKPFSNP